MVSLLRNGDSNGMETEIQPMLEIDPNIILTNNNKESISDQILIQTEDSHQKRFELIWKDLTFIVNERWKTIKGIPYKIVNTKQKIIEKQCGKFISGKLTGILGPNGAGKTTLIECLGGRRKAGFTGQVSIINNGFSNRNQFLFEPVSLGKAVGFKKNIKISYYSQKDILLDLLTVEETLSYCFQLKRCHNSITKSLKSSLPFEVEKLINDFHLKKCSQTWVDKCSGGQRRRLSIALELIFSPSIILLDEPTSGLDSVSSLQCIQLLKQMIESSGNSMLIAVVIHQPNAKLLSYFDDLYVLSSTGQCIYEGSSTQMVEKMSQFGLQCSQFCNPSDFALEIGSGDYGMDVIQQLAEHHNNLQVINYAKENSTEMSKIVDKTREHGLKQQISMVWPLTKRSLRLSLKDPKQYALQLSSVVMMLVLVYILHMDYKIGPFNACLRRLSPEFVRDLAVGLFDIQNPEFSAFPNLAFLFYTMLFVVFITMLPTLLSFPLELTVLRKEYLNGWYSLSSYFVAKNIGDLPPNFIFPVIYSVVSYLLTEQIPEMWRFLAFTSLLILLSILSQGMGFVVSALFADNVTGAVLIGSIVNIPLLTFSGLLIKLQTLPNILKPFSYLSYFRLAYESLIVTIYGFDRCEPFPKITFTDIKSEFGDHIIQMTECVKDFEPQIVENFTFAFDFMNDLANKSVSYPIILFEFNESNYLFNIIFLICYAIILRIIAYILLVWKIKVK